MDINKIKEPTDDRSDSHLDRPHLILRAIINLNNTNNQKVILNNELLNERFNHSDETLKKVRTIQRVIYNPKTLTSKILTTKQIAPGEDSTDSVDPVGEFVVTNTALNPVFKLVGQTALYGASKLGNNYARNKIISLTMDNNLVEPNEYLNNTYGETTNYLFDKLHPELNNIGSKELYKQYLYRMMPTSSTNKVYYHGSNSNFSDGFNSAVKGIGSGAPETKNEMYFAELPEAVLQYVDGVNTNIKDNNGFKHWNKLWWQAKEMLGNGLKDNWKSKTITELRLLIPNKHGIFDDSHGKTLAQIKSYYNALDMSDKDFAKKVFNIDLGKESFNDWVSKNKELFDLIWKTKQFDSGVYPVRINTTNPYIEFNQDTYYRDRGVFNPKLNDAILSNAANNEFNSNVAVVFNPKDNVNFLGSKLDLKTFKQFVSPNNIEYVPNIYKSLGLNSDDSNFTENDLTEFLKNSDVGEPKQVRYSSKYLLWLNPDRELLPLPKWYKQEPTSLTFKDILDEMKQLYPDVPYQERHDMANKLHRSAVALKYFKKLKGSVEFTPIESFKLNILNGNFNLLAGGNWDGIYSPKRNTAYVKMYSSSSPELTAIHELTHKYLHTLREGTFDAYTTELKNYLNNVYKVLDNPNFSDSNNPLEKGATNAEIRRLMSEYYYLEKGNYPNLKELNSFIDKLPDSQLKEFFDCPVNGYHLDYIKGSKFNALDFRNALKYVPGVLQVIKNNNEKK